MKKVTTTSVFGIVGIISWTLTLLLRETTVNSMETVKFILGVMPNISATWFFIWIGEIIFTRLNMNFTFKISAITSGLIFLFSITSEIIHDLFLNSPFDMYDITGTIFAITLYLTTFYINKNRRNINV